MSGLQIAVRAGLLDQGTPIVVELVNRELKVRRTVLSVGETRQIDMNPGHYLLRVRFPAEPTISMHISVPESGVQEIVVADVSDALPDVESESSVQSEYASASHSEPFEFESPWYTLWTRTNDEWTMETWPENDVVLKESANGFICELPGWLDRPALLHVGGLHIPWRFVALPPSNRWTLLASPSPESSASNDGGVKISVRTSSSRADALLGYASSGMLSAAGEVGESLIEAKRELLTDRQDPAGAAIAAYFLLRVGGDDQLGIWPQRLADRISWFADGPVIHAWQVLRSSDPDLPLVRKRLLQAVARGLPVYTVGMRLLYDALSLFDREVRRPEHGLEDVDVSNALETVRSYCAATDWNQPLTTFYGPAPTEPSLRVHTGVLPGTQEP